MPEDIIIYGKNNEDPLFYEKLDFSIIDDDIDLENDELHIGFNIIGLNDIKYEPISGADYTFHEVINDVKQKAF